MDVPALVDEVRTRLLASADPEKAGAMAAYMKTDMPFYGVQKAGRVSILRQVARSFPPADRLEYEEAVLALWAEPHREEKYLAIAYARRFAGMVSLDSMPLYRRLIVEGAWWDFVDEVSSHLVGEVLLTERMAATPVVRDWIDDDSVWLRRASIICQLRHKEHTDLELLTDACLANASDTEFFIRKAIGWALREHSKTNPTWTAEFIDEHGDRLSALSIREGSKYV